MPPSLVHRWAGLIGAERIIMAYGMTEAIGITALRGDEWMKHEGSVGRGMRGTEIRILDPDGADVPTGEVGEIFLRSPTYGGSNYLGDAPQLRETPDGFRTVGDLGYLDDDGFLYVADRRVDMIITGGANVFPAEVEKALIDHPKIADIVVVGLRDAEWGRRVHAIIEPADPGVAADARGDRRVRQEPARAVQGAEDHRAGRRDPAQRGDEGQSRPAGRGPGRLSGTAENSSWNRTLLRACASSSWRSGSSCRWPARCSPTGAPTSSTSSRSQGDPYRGLMTQGIGAGKGGVNLSMALANRGKRSLALDVRSEQGRAVAAPAAGVGRRLPHQPAPEGAANASDSTPRPSRERYPRLVYARGHGYGVRGPDADQRRLRRVRVLGPRRAGAHPDAARPRLPDRPARRDG